MWIRDRSSCTCEANAGQALGSGALLQAGQAGQDLRDMYEGAVCPDQS